MTQRNLAADSSNLAEQDERVIARLQLQVGDMLGNRYRVMAHLGSGGMGEVYEVEHVVLGRHFAAKVLRRELSTDATLVSRFGSEVRAMARLRSDHVAHIVDVGNLENGAPYFVMELLKGVDLKTLLRRVGSLAPRRAVGLLSDACWGLHAAHEAGLVHRDIKPSNLFVADTDSGGERCLLLDFGVTKSDTTGYTRTGQIVGTPQYMAPEQLEEGTVDARSDLYAVGAVLYECLVGRPPHKGETLERVLYSIMNKDPTPLWKQRPEISEGLSRVVECALARSPASRFASASAMADALKPYRGSNGGSTAIADCFTTAVLPTLSVEALRARNRLLWIVGLWGLLAAVSGWMVWSRMSSRRAAEPSPNAVVGIATGTTDESSTAGIDKVTDAMILSVPAIGTHASAARDAVTSTSARVGDDTSTKPPSRRASRASTASSLRTKAQASVIDSTNPYAN